MMCINVREIQFYILTVIHAKSKLQPHHIPSIWLTFIDNVSLRSHEKNKFKASSIFTKTINHFQVHGSSICRRSHFFINSVALYCQRLPCKLVLKMNAFMFWFGPLNSLLCNYILCKSLCVHLGPFGILCSIAVTTRALTKSKFKPTL